jgi:hypothetical protein
MNSPNAQIGIPRVAWDTNLRHFRRPTGGGNGAIEFALVYS